LADAGPAAAAKNDRAPSGRSDSRDDPRRDLVSAPPPKPGFFGGPRGTFDSLPGVAQGSLTMLNTKADRFAPFVRRVGTRVFQNLLIFQRQNLGINDILAAHEPVTVRCILDREGHLRDVRVEDRSGSLAVDQTLTDALREAAFDSNPPPSAANANGEFEFVFVSQIQAQLGNGPSGPQVQMIESRLRVGLM
ncbi:MAG: energy transducer TonB, partial [Alphaproteobacteria bacterium]